MRIQISSKSKTYCTFATKVTCIAQNRVCQTMQTRPDLPSSKENTEHFIRVREKCPNGIDKNLILGKILLNMFFLKYAFTLSRMFPKKTIHSF